MESFATLETSSLRTPRATWYARIEEAGDIEAVLAIARDYLATLTPRHLARLPEECRPGRIKGDDDIEYWTIQLAHHRSGRDTQPVDGGLLQEVLNFFLHCSLRISQIHKSRSVHMQ